MKNQCFAYIRVSTVKQGEGVSLEAQKDAIERYADQQNLTVIRWLEEKETAAKQGRPVFTEMVKLLKSGAAQGLIMHKIDRSARNLRDWATVGDLQDAGIDVHFAAESVDFTSRGGRLTADIQAVIAADYIRNLKEEIRKGQHGRLKQGLYPFTAPFGYVDAGKGNPKGIDAVRGPMVREIFELYGTGEYSFLSLEREMYSRGLRSKSGKRVYLSKIDTILSNPFYAGLIRLESYAETFQGQHDPLIPMELFNRVQGIRKQRAHKRKTKHTHLYRGVFVCRECRKAMIGERQRGHVYYRCHTSPCPSNSIRETAIDWQVMQSLSQFRLSKKHLSTLQHRLLSALEQEPDTRQATRLKNTQIATQVERLTDAYLQGTIDEQTFTSRKTTLDFRQAEIAEMAQKQNSKAEKELHIRKFLEHVQNLARTYFYADCSEKRQILKLCYSNKFIFAKTVELEPENWLWSMDNRPLVLVGTPHNSENRSHHKLGDLAFPDIIDMLTCPDARRLVEICDAVQERCGGEKLSISSFG